MIRVHAEIVSRCRIPLNLFEVVGDSVGDPYRELQIETDRHDYVDGVYGTRKDPANGEIVVTGGPDRFDIQLRADKGQIYTLTATATDMAGNLVKKQATCTVPHDQGK